ncbi:MAG: hypothetical protein HC827_20020 [Cyanobacteria bacterium RM1_2_2]|nr:hypothetical protein [Cyanobacteria bacterium RM1_2_2]
MSSNLSRFKGNLHAARKGQLADAVLTNFHHQFHAIDAQIWVRSHALMSGTSCSENTPNYIALQEMP